MTTPSLLIRADAGPAIGAGHVMRCLALAQAWKRIGGRALFLQAQSTAALERRVRDAGFEALPRAAVPGSAEDAAQTAALAIEHAAWWVVADGYRFGGEWQQQVKAAGVRLLAFDDYGHSGHCRADFILNQNLHADAALYAVREAGTRLLLGVRYVQLREEFLAERGEPRQIPAVARRILITLGGGDSGAVASEAVRAVAALNDVEAVLTVGGCSPQLEPLRALLRETQAPIRLIEDATNMAELMAWADVAIAASGATSWELARLGLPSLVVALAENQVPVAEALAREGIAINLAWHAKVSHRTLAEALRALLDDASRRRAMSDAGRRLVDGLGADRVVTRLLADTISLRPAEPADEERLWKWANDPAVRRAAFRPAEIPWADHRLWFGQKLASPRCAIFLADDTAGNPFGQIRFDWDDDGEAEVDVSIAPGRRQRGWGSALIRRGVDALFERHPVSAVRALIRPENAASVRAFERAGFEPRGAVSVHGCQAVNYGLSRETTGSGAGLMASV